MKQSDSSSYDFVAYYTRKLEEFEKKYGVSWVKRKYENTPTKNDPFYDFAMKMHSVYVYRQNGKAGDIEILKQALEKKKEPSAKKEIRQYRGYDISPQLQASLSGFNGGRRGKQMSSPEEFYERWLKWKFSKAKNPKVKKVAEEGIEKKGEVLLLISHFFSSRQRKLQGLPPKIEKAKKTVLKKTTKLKKQTRPLPFASIIETNSDSLSIYFTDAGTKNNGSRLQDARICVFKNGFLLIDKAVGNHTSNEGEYLALISALLDIGDKKAIIYSDSQLTVFTVNDFWKVKAKNLRPLYIQARKLLKENIRIEWTPREKNLAGHYLEEKYKI